MLSKNAKITRTCLDGQVRVLYVVSAYPRHPGDVITPWLTETIRRLRAADVEVEVLAPAYRGSASQVVDGVRIHRFRYAPAGMESLTHDQTAPDRVRERPLYLALVPGYVLAGSLAAVRLARSKQFDLVHVFWPIPHGLFGVAARRVTGIPLVCTFFGVELTWLREQFPLLRAVLKQIVRESDAVTAISLYTAAQLRDQVPEAKSTVIPFGAAVESQTRSAPERAAGAPFQLLFVGRLVERKGVRFLLDALAELQPMWPVQLDIVGDGPLRTELEAYARVLRLEGIVQFRGSVPRAELELSFVSCDAFVLPAVTDSKGDTEGLGVVLLEAMSYGKPVIASATGGIVDIVHDHETGLLVPPGDARALASAIRLYIREPQLAAELARAGRVHAEGRFGWPAIIGQLTRLYASLLPRVTGSHAGA